MDPVSSTMWLESILGQVKKHHVKVEEQKYLTLSSVGANPMGVNGGVGAPSQSQQANLLQDTMMHLNVTSQG